jgi:hypothetical protein
MSHRKIIYFSLILLLFSVCGSTAARSLGALPPVMGGSYSELELRCRDEKRHYPNLEPFIESNQVCFCGRDNPARHRLVDVYHFLTMAVFVAERSVVKITTMWLRLNKHSIL